MIMEQGSNERRRQKVISGPGQALLRVLIDFQTLKLTRSRYVSTRES